LKTHREEVLFQQETALLPETQPYVEEEIRKENINKEILDLRREQSRLENQIINLRATLYNGRTVTERREFVRECPAEDCRGFLSTAWKCGVCEKWTCPDCHEVKGTTRDVEHTCNPDAVATAQLLARDTKPCPKCRTGIFKIDGCDQMWCTQCHTGFNWRTGRIETNVHNPHFFEWQRRNAANGQIPRTLGDNPGGQPQCGNIIDHNTSRNILQLIRLCVFTDEIKSTYRTLLTNLIRHIVHIREVTMPNYVINYVGYNRFLRVRYMRNLMSETEFKTIIQRNSKKSDKHTEIRNVLELLLNTVSDIIHRVNANLVSYNRSPQDNTVESVFEPIQEINAIVEYSNECFREIGKTYTSKPLQFNDQLEQIFN